jgi:hypothetical protein
MSARSAVGQLVEEKQMATMTRPKPHAGDRLEYRFYLALVYPLFLLAAMLRPARGRPSVFRRAFENAASVVPWVFTGR